MNNIDDLLAGTLRSRQRLGILVSGLDQDALDRNTTSGWSVAATLAHLAFYDDWVAERWRRYLTVGAFQNLPDDITDLVNTAGGRGWRAVDSMRARTIVIEAADTVTHLIEQLPSTALVDAVNTDRPAMVDRSLHWDPHLDEIEQACRKG